MMNKKELLMYAEQHRADLPEGFAASIDELELQLTNNRTLISVTKSQESGDGNHKIKQAVVAELHQFLCTNNKRYSDVRKSGETISKGAIAAISGYLAGAAGLSIAAATACVSFILLAALKVGVGAFCRLSTQ